jgi:pyrroloquinoline quinone (PQQ) biosynthesis protein C
VLELDEINAFRTGQAMPPEAAKKLVDRLYERAHARWMERVSGGRFMTALKAGTLSMDAIRLFWKNWYGFVAEINNFNGIIFQRFGGWFKTHPEFLAAYSEKIADELIHPTPPGHIQIVLQQGRVFGLTDDEMIHCLMLPECRAWLDWARGLVYEGSMAERWAFHTVEEQIGYWSKEWREALTGKYGLSADKVVYFKTHEEADLEVHEGSIMAHGEFNRRMLQQLLQEGNLFPRPGYPIEYVSLVTIDFAALFFEGVYREATGEQNWGWR